MSCYHDENRENQKYQVNSRVEEEEEEESSSSSSQPEFSQIYCRDMSEEELTDDKIQEIMDYLKYTYGERLEKAIQKRRIDKEDKRIQRKWCKNCYLYI